MLLASGPLRHLSVRVSEDADGEVKLARRHLRDATFRTRRSTSSTKRRRVRLQQSSLTDDERERALIRLQDESRHAVAPATTSPHSARGCCREIRLEAIRAAGRREDRLRLAAVHTHRIQTKRSDSTRRRRRATSPRPPSYATARSGIPGRTGRISSGVSCAHRRRPHGATKCATEMSRTSSRGARCRYRG
jgi:hypothetical protein